MKLSQFAVMIFLVNIYSWDQIW